MRAFYVFLFSLLIVLDILAQNTIRGRIINAQQEPLELALIYVKNDSLQVGTTTDQKGNYILSDVPPGSYTIKFSYTGYETVSRSIKLYSDTVLNVTLTGDIFQLEALEITGNRLNDNAPFRYSNISGKSLRKENLGQDLPVLLQNSTSLVFSSDAGNGIGYTSMRIRGSDQSRINVTINGVPVNDAESQGVFWVNMPDLVSSADNIQIQRGVGASTNGAGAFGGTVSINTNQFRINPYTQASLSMGSFGTLKSSLRFGTGLMNQKFTIDGSYSIIKSDGFIDRASSELQGLYLSAAKISDRSVIRFQVISGKETTYQAWNGVPQDRFYNNDQNLLNHYFRNQGVLYLTREDSLNLFNADQRYNYYTYKNQVDDYRQTQSQLVWSQKFKNDITAKSTFFYTFGTGYFEQYRYQDELENYGFRNVTDEKGQIINAANIIRRRWLRNHFFGYIGDITGKIGSKAVWSGGLHASRYIGGHFGHIIDTDPAIISQIYNDYYRNNGYKNDFSLFLRAEHQIAPNLSYYADAQFRSLTYDISGTDNDLRSVIVTENYHFFNPKFGLNYGLGKNGFLIASVAVARKEPSRSDFLDHAGQGPVPEPEVLTDYEFAYKHATKTWNIETGLFYMDYKNQLVLNGNLNDVGSPLRINVPSSYRLGWETEFRFKIHEKADVSGNITYSKNVIHNFRETLYDYTNGFNVLEIEHGNTPISFSPQIVSGIQASFLLWKNLEVVWASRYISKQHMDNTGQKSRSIPSYHYHNVRLSWKRFLPVLKETEISISIQNLLNRKFYSNGYTYSYIYNEQVTENFVYPQAGINLLIGIQCTL